jgi:hypothetical protein
MRLAKGGPPHVWRRASHLRGAKELVVILDMDIPGRKTILTNNGVSHVK